MAMTANKQLGVLMILNKRGVRFSDEKGAELVETSLVILLFILLVLGIFQFGRALNVYQTITNAAREGARFAVAPQRGGSVSYPSTDEVRTVIVNFLNSANLSDPGPINLQILTNQSLGGVAPCDPTVSGSPCGTKVDLSYPFSIFGFGAINLRTSVVMRNET
jgi:Flp pilus assembly protein TadG